MTRSPALPAWLLASLLLWGGCKLGDQGRGRRGADQAPSGRKQSSGESSHRSTPLTPSGCEALCASHGKCLDNFTELGAEAFFSAPLNAGVGGSTDEAEQPSCVVACQRTAQDSALGGVLKRVFSTCVARRGCDDFYGCALRLHLLEFKDKPWIKWILDGRKRVLQILRDTRREWFDKAMRSCGSARTGRLLRQLGKVDRTGAKAAVLALTTACVQAASKRQAGLVKLLMTKQRNLEPDGHTRACGILRGEDLPSWMSPRDSAFMAARKRARRLCDALDARRPVAFAVKYAVRDSQYVVDALAAGRADDTVYYKCVHKGKTYSMLVQAGNRHPQAKRAAEILRRACFEQFPVAYLGRHRRASPGFNSRDCYKVKQVVSLLENQGGKAVRDAQKAIIAWARARCPD